MSDIRFDLEQQIMNCWHIVDEIKLLNQHIHEEDPLNRDTISHFLTGLETIYEMKFDQMFKTFEAYIKENHKKF